MFGTIATVALCYLAVGIYVLLVFDHADHRRGLAVAEGLGGQALLIVTWPGFLYFVADDDEYIVEIGDE